MPLLRGAGILETFGRNEWKAVGWDQIRGGPRKIRGIWALGWKNTPNNFVPRGTAKRVRAEGPTHRPAKGNALEDGRQQDGFLGPTGQPVFSGEWLGRWPERPPSHGHLDPGRCPSLGDLTPVPGSHAPAQARNKFGINCHPCPVALLRGPDSGHPLAGRQAQAHHERARRAEWWACARDHDHGYMVPDMVPAELVPPYSSFLPKVLTGGFAARLYQPMNSWARMN